MKKVTLILAIFCINTTQAQYNIDRINAPMNPLPIGQEYTKAHFGLKGNVEKMRNGSYSFKFDSNGNLVSVSGIRSSTFMYDAKGKLIKISYPGLDTLTSHVETDSKGRITKITYSNEVMRSFSYNLKGLLFEEGTGNNDKTIYTYDIKGRIISAKNKKWEENYTYEVSNGILKIDKKDVLQNEDMSKATTNSYYYNDKGFQIYELTGEFLYTYDEQGNPLSIVDYVMPNNRSYKYFNKPETAIEERIIPSSADAFGAKCISGDCLNGWGKTVYMDGSYYEGFWTKGFRNGYGTFESKIFIYTGEWKNHNINGVGYGKTQTENLFGNFVNSKLNGDAYRISKVRTVIGLFSDGACFFPLEYTNNNVLKGCVKGNCKYGFGQYVYDADEVFEGFFLNEERSLGELKILGRSNYQGQFEGGLYNGFGRYQGSDGIQYAGYWKNGKYNGLGYYQESNGKNTKKGLWENGVLVKPM